MQFIDASVSTENIDISHNPMSTTTKAIANIRSESTDNSMDHVSHNPISTTSEAIANIGSDGK